MEVTNSGWQKAGNCGNNLGGGKQLAAYRDGVWVRDRRLNGDETMFLRFEDPTLLRVKVLCYA